MQTICTVRLTGMSLIETSLVVAILGVILAGIVPLLRSTQMANQLRLTTQNQTHVLQALGAYVLLHKKLPCPSQFDHAIGIEQTTCQQSFVGIIPYRTLGIPKRIAMDGRGNFITYAVDPKLTTSSRALSDSDNLFPKEQVFCTKKSEFTLQIQNENGEIEYPSPIDPTALILVCHGLLGGFWVESPSGLRRAPLSPQIKGGSAKDQNTKTDGIFITRPISLEFDDIVIGISRQTLLALYGGGPCKP